MAKITFTDLKKIENFWTPSATDKGYVLDFTNADFQTFIDSVTGIDIYEEGKYDDNGTSKAKLFLSFIAKESDHAVGRVLMALAEYQQTLSSDYCSPKVEAREIVDIANSLIQGNSTNNNSTTGKAYFGQIREQILEKLEKSEFTIWVAVAWFTDPVLFQCLSKKKAQGLNIQVIINDDKNNNSSDLDYDQLEVYKLPPIGSQGKNIMHNKFCIIDFNVVIHGSYNWTKTANYNKETIEISYGYQKAKRFSKEFMNLKLQAMSKQNN